MNKKIMPTLLLVLLCSFSYAQKVPVKFGDVSLEDIKMTQYEKDTSAAAVILADYGVSSISYDHAAHWFKLIFERTTRIKILKKVGYAYADFEIPLYHNTTDEERLFGLRVTVHNLENGKVVETKMKSDGVFKEKYSQTLDLQKFTAPNVKEGSVIEVTYKISSDLLHYFRDWEFQSKIPVVWSEYCANIPEYFNYAKYVQGYIALDITQKGESPRSFTITSSDRSGFVVVRTTLTSNTIRYQEQNFRWAAIDVPAFKEEPFMTTHHDYISKINFELSSYQFPHQPLVPVMGTWADLNKAFLEDDDFGNLVKGSGFLKKITEDVVVGLNSPQEKIEAIHKYVRTNVEWDGRNRVWADHTLKDVVEKKKGSSAEINLTLVSMLQKAGITANPVILSTRNNGFVRESFAMSSQFNYVICQAIVDGQSFLFDATDKMLPIFLLPEKCLNGMGYVISETPEWVNLTSPKSKIAASTEVSIVSGELKGKISISHEGYDARTARSEYFKKGEPQYVKDFTEKMSWVIEKSELKNTDNINLPLSEMYEFRLIDGPGDGPVLYINPFLYLRQEENPFKSDTRLYPVDFGKTMDRIYIWKFTIPDNYDVEEMPQTKAYMMPDKAMRYIYNMQVVGNTITLTSMFSVNQSLFVQTDYQALREFYDVVVAKQAEQIVLKKKS